MNRQTERHIDRQTDRQTDKKADCREVKYLQGGKFNLPPCIEGIIGR